ncbi:MAG: NAD(P)-binding domain-containing protein [Phaeodactylibacter sp.]|nr:NAD(P)-binding domain-containing protein [Phaeodactylibacter sp.]MCB9299875.1 NAD(P)-binding domain-containing protein [Lewinellaceae bacterium]
MKLKQTSPRVCVIGAGCSGLAAIKHLIQAGVEEIVCFEQNDQVGGNWIFTAGESHSSVCETTHIISSRKLSQFEDFPMPEHYPDYPSHKQVLAYFQSYARHFGLEKYIRFNTAVARAEELPDKKWKITLKNGEEQHFDYLVTANGHHSTPRWPDIPGNFTGDYIHSHTYKSNQPFSGKRVLVIGVGNSGCDCAVEVSRVAEFTAISMRRPTYIIPKFFLGKPTDTFNEGLLWVPRFLQRPLQQLSLRIQVGDYRDYGLERPDFPVTKCHPTLNSELLYRIRHGRVHPRKGISRFEGQAVHFTDGKVEKYDAIIAATGYKIAFPFFSRDFINFEEATRIPLYLRMIHADHPTLFLIGMTQPQGCIWPLSDLQSKLAANCIMGRWAIPRNVRELAEKECDEIERDFIHTKRHSLEVHFFPFLNKLKRSIPKNAPEWETVAGGS